MSGRADTTQGREWTYRVERASESRSFDDIYIDGLWGAPVWIGFGAEAEENGRLIAEAPALAARLAAAEKAHALDVERVAEWLFNRIVYEERQSSTTSWEHHSEALKDGWRTSARKLIAAAAEGE